METVKKQYGKLFVTSIHIGNVRDITLRAIDTLKEVDFIICEEYKEAARLLNHLQIKKELIALNEHNEKEEANDVILRLLAGENGALISDCGTPLFSDPGHLLVELCYSQKIKVVPVPGVSSLVTALSISGLDIEKFYYYGWLSPKKEERQRELAKLRAMKELIVLLDTPYRLKSLLRDIEKVFGRNKFVVVAYNLTLENEKVFRKPIHEMLKIAEEKNLKGEFVLLLENRK